jgi:superfamily II DNA/RNA helicase
MDSKTGSLPDTLKHYVVTDHDDVEGFDSVEEQSQPSADELMDTVLHVVRSSQAGSILLFVPTSVSIDDTVAMLRTHAITGDGPDSPPMMIRAEALYTHVHGVKPAEAQVRRQAIVNRIATANSSQPYVIVVNMDTARGLDLPGVEMAVLVGTPRTHSDYQHIAGRVGRAGCQGTVVTVGYDAKQTVRIKKMAASLKVELSRMLL